MATVVLTKDNFEQIVTGSPMVVVDFWAPWCGPCRSFAPIFEQASEEHAGIVFAKLNTEDEGEVASFFNIRSIPTLMIFRERVVIYSQAGALPASHFKDLLEKAQAIDMAQVHAEIKEREAAVQTSGAEQDKPAE